MSVKMGTNDSLQKIMVEQLATIEFEFDVSLFAFHSQVDDLIAKYGGDAVIEKEYYGHDGAYYIIIKSKKLENDFQFEQRLKQVERERKAAAKQQQEQYKLYLKLKKQFEGK